MCVPWGYQEQMFYEMIPLHLVDIYFLSLQVQFPTNVK